MTDMLLPVFVPQQISATRSNLFNDSHAVRFIHLAFSADGYHVLK